MRRIALLVSVAVGLSGAACSASDSGEDELRLQNATLVIERDDLQTRLDALCARIDQSHADETTIDWLADVHDELC